MRRKYEKLAQEIVKKVGGKENIISCIPEIRFLHSRKNGKSKSRTTENKNLSVRDFFVKQRLVLCASSEADCEYPIRNDDCE